jgi:predicted DNA-binding transcriptional regulator AlpA
LSDESQNQLLSERQLAAELGLAPATLRKWRARNAGPPFIRLSRRAIRYRRADVERWLAANARRTGEVVEK